MTANRTVADGLDRILGKMARKWRAIQEKVEKDALPSDRVLGALQAIHDGRFAAEGDRAIVVPQHPRLIRDLFTPPNQQLVNFWKWSAQHLETWKDVPIEDWFARLGPVPAWPDGEFQCLVLDLTLPDRPEVKDANGNILEPAVPGYVRTVQDFWKIVCGQHRNYRKLDQLLLDQEHLFLLDGATYEPGLRWRVLDLGANWDKVDGIAPATVRDPHTSPNTDGFSALMHHPRYVRRMDSMKVPYFWIPGFQVTVLGADPQRFVPLAGFYRGACLVNLDMGRDNYQGSHCAVPVRLGGAAIER